MTSFNFETLGETLRRFKDAEKVFREAFQPVVDKLTELLQDDKIYRDFLAAWASQNFGEERFANSAWWGMEDIYEQRSSAGTTLLVFTERYWAPPRDEFFIPRDFTVTVWNEETGEVDEVPF